MPAIIPLDHNISSRRLAAFVTLLTLALSLAPYVERFRWPSLYADDVDRMEQLQTLPLGTLLFRPCNEHLAPLFQLQSWLIWQLAGHRLSRMPLFLTVASFLPFVGVLALVSALTRRATRSAPAALAAVVLFSLSWLSIETVYWYSASSFMWALVMTLVAWLATATDHFAVAAVASACAPAFSGVGLLAGPVAALPAIFPGDRKKPHWASLRAPLVGTLLYLAFAAAVHDRATVAMNVGQKAGLMAGLWAAARAPAAALVPAVLGIGPVSPRGIADALTALTTVAIAVTMSVMAFRGRPAERSLWAGGLLLICGGYALTFTARAGEPGRALLETQRYHLFPMLGLVLAAAPTFRRLFEGIRPQSVSSDWYVLGLAIALSLLNSSEMKGRARFLKYPDQVRTLAAIDRLGVICLQRGVTREQALHALDPIEAKWTPVGHSALAMLARGAARPAIADGAVKTTLLAALTPAERRSICGGMDATPYFSSASGTIDSGSILASGRPVALYRVFEEAPGRFVSAGWPSFIEYELEGRGDGARVLLLSQTGPSDLVEVWWRGEVGKWSETQSVRIRTRDIAADARASSALSLEALPHWNASQTRRIRLLFHEAGPVAVTEPRLIR